MKQWLRPWYILVYEDINAGRTDWWERMEARTDGLTRVPSLPGNRIVQMLEGCLSDPANTARLGTIFELIHKGDPWLTDTVGDLGLDVPFVTDNAGLGSQLYRLLRWELYIELTSGPADALALQSEVLALEVSQAANDDETSLVRVLVLAGLNRAHHWIKAAEDAGYAGWAANQKALPYLGTLKGIERRLMEGAPLSNRGKAFLTAVPALHRTHLHGYDGGEDPQSAGLL